MVLCSLVVHMLLPDPLHIIFRDVKFCDHCDNIVVNLFLCMKVSIPVDPMESVELAVKDILYLLWCPTFSCSCNYKKLNNEFPCSNKYPREGLTVIHAHPIILCIPIEGLFIYNEFIFNDLLPFFNFLSLCSKNLLLHIIFHRTFNLPSQAYSSPETFVFVYP